MGVAQGFRSLLLVFVCTTAVALADYSATVRFPDAGGAKKFPLTVTDTSAPVTVSFKKPKSPTTSPYPSPSPQPTAPPMPPEFEASVKIRGLLDQSESSLLFGSSIIVTSQATPASFEIKVPLTAQVTKIEVSVIDPLGALTVIPVEIEFDSWASLSGEEEKPWTIVPSLGFNYLNYTESSVGTLGVFGLSAKVRSAYRPRGKLAKFDAGVRSQITVLPIIRSDDTRATRLWSNEARIGYRTPWLKGAWTLDLHAAYHFVTMLVHPSDHGFGGLHALSIYPSVARPIGRGQGSAYIRYSPVLGLALGNSEFALGVAWQMPWKTNKSLVFDLDISNIAFASTDQTLTTRTANLWSFFLSGGVRF